MIVVADTGPANYLVLSGQIDLVHVLYGALLIPLRFTASFCTRGHRRWSASGLRLVRLGEVRPPTDVSRFSELGPGEREAIALVLEIKADFLLIDETEGRRTAVRNGIAVRGTLGILEEAANRGLVHLPEAVKRLQGTGMFLTEDIVQTVLDRQRDRRPDGDHEVER